eukprot:TRINITY_DN19118_c0_g1_i1.p1 TRINITY_DN19118_c0_g1~~TRINITY_DN19118_c0_g1_i1.p1  ORF type:complete len:1100 (+),score=208.89 TRINITY_DN19118_c0_g1_i1:181-3300(+)
MAARSEIKVIKASTDKRDYRVVHLQNGLTAVLVHDPEIFGNRGTNPLDRAQGEDEEDDEYGVEEDREESEDEDEDDSDRGEEDDGDEENEMVDDVDAPKANDSAGSATPPPKMAAAAMCVGVGSFSDPMDAQGLAHFLEHMLFMGSSEFPDENEYDSFLSKHGGSSNAYTETEHTCFYFNVNRKYLKPALKRFSQFFVAPLVKAEAMEREVQAVDSEFHQALQSDGCRLQQLQCYTSNPDHPFNRFMWGNRKSLVEPISKGINMRTKLLDFYKEYYLGGSMKLAVIGGESLDTLEEWVQELFGNVRTGVAESVKVLKIGPAWESGKVFWTQAVRDLHVVKITWTLPCLNREYLKKPEDYLSHLIGHEGRGSLLSLLKRKGWATSLSAGVGDDSMDRSSAGSLFVVSIDLTDLGLKKVFDVIGFLYQFVKLLQEMGPQEWVFKELQDIGNVDFRFAEEQPQDDYAAELAVNLLRYTEEHIIYGAYAFEIWDPVLVEQTLSYLKPENMRIDVLTKCFDRESSDMQYEPWFNVPYRVDIIPSYLIEQWRNPHFIDHALHLPDRNDFIPSDFTIKGLTNSKDHHNKVNPKLVIDNSLLRLWYKLDQTFHVPRANTYFLIQLKGCYKDVKACVLTELFVELLRDALNEKLYQANVASLNTKLSIVRDNLELRISGFNEKIHVLASEIIRFLIAFKPAADRFEVIKEDIKRNYLNTNIKPLKHATYLRLQILNEYFWHVDEKLSCLLKLTLDDLLVSIPELLSQVYVEGLCHGNLLEDEAITLANIVRSAFSATFLQREEWDSERILKLPPRANFVHNSIVKNQAENNSVIELYYQMDQDIGMQADRARALADLFEEIVHEPFFNQLRTKEQLGYVVDCGTRMTHRVLGFCFRVQSDKYSPTYLQERIDTFISDLPQMLECLNDAEFEGYKTALIAKKLEKDPSLIDETNYHWDQIVNKRYSFEMLKLEADELTRIDKADIMNWYNVFINSASSACRRLSIRIWGCNTLETCHTSKSNSSHEIIDDIPALKLRSEFYPALSRSFC